MQWDPLYVSLLEQLCSSEGLPRLQMLLGDTTSTTVDTITAVIVVLLDHVVLHFTENHANLKLLNPLLPQLRLLLTSNNEHSNTSNTISTFTPPVVGYTW